MKLNMNLFHKSNIIYHTKIKLRDETQILKRPKYLPFKMKYKQNKIVDCIPYIIPRKKQLLKLKMIKFIIFAQTGVTYEESIMNVVNSKL